jgi:hypothetical protein
MGSKRFGRAGLAPAIRSQPAGELRPAVERAYPLAEAAAAHERIAPGRGRGKIVLAPRCKRLNWRWTPSEGRWPADRRHRPPGALRHAARLRRR